MDAYRQPAALAHAYQLFREAAAEAKLQQADFVMLRDARIVFEGSADELRQSRDQYLKAFLS